MATLFISVLSIPYTGSYLPFLVAASIAVFEYKANQITDMVTPGIDWASDRFAADFDADEEDPLVSLRREYVDGDISEAEFERRLERLIGNEEDVGRVPLAERSR